jgi:hypothetical protein
MNYIKTYENFREKIIGYHITDYKNLESILKNGLEPRVPEDYGMDGDVKGVYFFKTAADMDNALGNWLGERIEELEEESGETYEDTLIVVDLTGLSLLDTVEFEWTCIEHIDPSRILETHKLDDVNGYELSEELDKKYN